MSFNIQDFKSRGLPFHGARPTLFDIQINNPPAGIATGSTIEKLKLTCRASELPPAIVESIPVGYFGREIKVSGDRTFPDWQVNIMNDEDFSVRDMMEKWSIIQNSMVANLRRDRRYKSEAIITQYGKEGNILRQYEMSGIFPTNIGPIQLSWDQKNQIETFDVQFSFDWWEPISGDGRGILGGLLG